MISASYRFENFIVDRVFIDLSILEISALYTVSFGPHDPHKNRFLMKIEVFRDDYLSRSGIVFRVDIWKLKVVSVA